MIRSFIAIPLPAEVRHRLATFQDELRQAVPGGAVRWTRPEQIHLTLRFLGNVPESELPGLTEAWRRACAGFTAFRLRASGAGCFPDLRRPKIIWAGLNGDLALLSELHRAIERGTEPWGEREHRAFHPHLTFGRMKKPDPRAIRSLGRALAHAANLDFGGWLVEEVTLMRSDLAPEGPRYQQLASVRLAAEQSGS
jgi:2'-5' RNA ligase